MGTDLELRKNQMEKLFVLLLLEKLNPGIKIEGLQLEIVRARTSMAKEDIAEVEKEIASL